MSVTTDSRMNFVRLYLLFFVLVLFFFVLFLCFVAIFIIISIIIIVTIIIIISIIIVIIIINNNNNNNIIVLLSTDKQWITVVLALIGKCGIAGAFSLIWLYSSELFPTVMRNSATGAASLCARAGGIVAPYIAQLVSSLPFTCLSSL